VAKELIIGGEFVGRESGDSRKRKSVESDAAGNCPSKLPQSWACGESWINGLATAFRLGAGVELKTSDEVVRHALLAP
jgi:hypothetical protein